MKKRQNLAVRRSKQSLLMIVSLFSLQSLQAQDMRMSWADAQQKLYGYGQTGLEKTKAFGRWIKANPKKAAALGLTAVGLGVGAYRLKSGRGTTPTVIDEDQNGGGVESVQEEEVQTPTIFPDDISVLSDQELQTISDAIQKAGIVEGFESLANLASKKLEDLAPIFTSNTIKPDAIIAKKYPPSLWSLRGYMEIANVDQTVAQRFFNELSRIASERENWIQSNYSGQFATIEDYYKEINNDLLKELPSGSKWPYE